MSHIVAANIGGTHIRVAFYEPNSRTPSAHQRTCLLANEPGVYDRLEQAVASIRFRKEACAIRIASLGLGDYKVSLGDEAGWPGALDLARMKRA